MEPVGLELDLEPVSTFSCRLCPFSPSCQALPFPHKGEPQSRAPWPQQRGPPTWRGPQCTAQAAWPSASLSPWGLWPPAPGQGPPPRPSASLPLTGSPPSEGRAGGVCGGARVTMSGLTRGSTGRLTVWGASEVRSQPTHWGRGPGAQVEYLREDMHGACPEEGGDPETDCLPTGVARAGAGQQGRVWRPGCRPAGLPGAAQIPSSSGHVGTLTLVTVSATFGSGTETGEGGGWVLL